jgi:hypothetical protein
MSDIESDNAPTCRSPPIRSGHIAASAMSDVQSSIESKRLVKPDRFTKRCGFR